MPVLQWDLIVLYLPRSTAGGECCGGLPASQAPDDLGSVQSEVPV